MTHSIRKILRRKGYVTLSEVRDLLARVCRRVEEFDEPMAREYMLNPYPGGIEHMIGRMCDRRKVVLLHIADEELNRITTGTAARLSP
jgi:hypothetical protein